MNDYKMLSYLSKQFLTKIIHSKGQVYISDRNFKTQSFVAYQGGRVTHLKQLKQRNVLVTVGVSIIEI